MLAFSLATTKMLMRYDLLDVVAMPSSSMFLIALTVRSANRQPTEREDLPSHDQIERNCDNKLHQRHPEKTNGTLILRQDTLIHSRTR